MKEASVVIRESFLPQISLLIQGDLPTPDAENKIDVELYSVSDPDKACVEVSQPFKEAIELGTFPSGQYTVWVNGELASEFDT